MKKGILFIGLVGVLISCNNQTEEIEEVKVETYSLDLDKSTIKWTGYASPEYFHTGTVNFSEGSMTFENDSLTNGEFVIDMTTIANTDIEDSAKAEVLVNHLKGLNDNERHKPEDFFHTTKFPAAKVNVGGYTNNELTITLELLGNKNTQTIPVQLTKDENGATVTGKFELDMEPYKVPALAPDPETGEKSKIEYELELHLTK